MTARISPSMDDGSLGSAAVKETLPAGAALTFALTKEVTSDSTLTELMSLLIVLAEFQLTGEPSRVTSPLTGV